MKKRFSIQAKKIMIVMVLFSATHIAMGSFTGRTDDKNKNKYSLKYFNQNFYKTASPFSLRTGFQYKGTQIVSQQKTSNDITFNTMLRYEKGNTTYIYPYKHKVNVPKFKAPVAPSNR